MPTEEEFIDPRPIRVTATMTDGTTHQQQHIGVSLTVVLATMKQNLETKSLKIRSFSISHIKDTNQTVREEPAPICLDTDWSKVEIPT